MHPTSERVQRRLHNQEKDVNPILPDGRRYTVAYEGGSPNYGRIPKLTPDFGGVEIHGARTRDTPEYDVDVCVYEHDCGCSITGADCPNPNETCPLVDVPPTCARIDDGSTPLLALYTNFADLRVIMCSMKSMR